MTHKLLDENQAAEYLGLSPKTLQMWRVLGRGPSFLKLSGRCVRYAVADVDKWIDGSRRNSTSDSGLRSDAAGSLAAQG